MLETPPPAAAGLQPLLHDAVAVLRAPAQAWSDRDGSMGGSPIHGVYVSDLRVVRALRVLLDDAPGEHVATLEDRADAARFVSLHRLLDGPGADPDTRTTLAREVTAEGVRHSVELRSRLDRPVRVRLAVELEADLTSVELVKSGRAEPAAIDPAVDGASAGWEGDGATVRLDAPGAVIERPAPGILRLAWTLEVAPRSSASAAFELRVRDERAVVAAPAQPAAWRIPSLEGADDRIARWVARALDDLDALRLTRRDAPGDVFLAAGAPWFFTLFGRDAIWAARFLLPLDPAIALGTLRALAALQGEREVVETAEQPGKIPHELRRAATTHATESMTLPPLYYGTVDATPLWVCLLVDAWRAGAPEGEIRALLPALESALRWMRDHGDSDGDGLLEYVDASGRGLANQGWKDSGDSVQWRDGRLAEGPLALCEVQAYAHEAATGAAELLEALGGDGGEWRAWAARLAERFRASFWIDDPAGAYPAIALDAAKRPVDSLTSNLGHLLGTGLLDERERALVARRLVSPELASGFGLRTMSTAEAGYWPLSYHGGSVWAHDTAIAISGLAADGFAAEAAELAEGLLRAAVAFDYRMPELHSGDARADAPRPVPYPAACRPQAWSAAAALVVHAATGGARATGR